jgi:uncharacterized protein (TIGR02117 family)
MSDSQIHFFREGMHTHLVLPAKSLLDYIPELKEQLQNAPWARIGWGDFQYYGASQQTLISAMRALLLPTSAVIAVLRINRIEDKVTASNRVYSIDCNYSVIDSLARFVSDYFYQSPQGLLTQVREKPNGEVFFKARGIYMLTNTCNNWTSRGLRIAGLRCMPLLSFFPGQVEQSVRRNGYLPLL